MTRIILIYIKEEKRLKQDTGERVKGCGNKSGIEARLEKRKREGIDYNVIIS